MAKRGHDAAGLERQKLARQRFRSLIRSVMHNRIWLNDEEEQKKISMNVKRNVAMLVRPRHKIGVLTMAEKALIRTPHVLRSVEDRKALLKLVIGLKCFKNLSPQIRARLIPVFKFMFLEAGRKIIKENGYADTIYFILYGEVEASRRVYDAYKGRYVDKIEFIYSSGDCIGDIELIEDCPRRHTYTATSAVELLVVFGEDFHNILKTAMTKQWREKRAAIKAIGYFDHFNDEQMISANKLSALKEFDALETIYHEDLGEASYAYFVLSGECMILQSLQLKVTESRFYKTYELLDISKAKAKDSPQRVTSKERLKKVDEEEKVTRKSIDIDDNVESDEVDSELVRINQALRASKLRTEIVEPVESSIKLGSGSRESEIGMADVESHGSPELEDLEGGEEAYSGLSEEKFEDSASTKRTLKDRESELKANVTSTHDQDVEGKTEQNAEGTEKMLSSIKKLKSTETSSTSHLSGTQKGSTQTNTMRLRERISLETRFIDVGSLTYGGIFGLGEKIEDRVIMARTKVQCLMLPRYWLFERDQNPGRIWQRRRFAIDTGIPSRRQLYEDFLNTRKWQKYKNDFISSLLDPNSIQNPTHYQDIPMMFHIINPVEE